MNMSGIVSMRELVICYDHEVMACGNDRSGAGLDDPDASIGAHFGTADRMRWQGDKAPGPPGPELFPRLVGRCSALYWNAGYGMSSY